MNIKKLKKRYAFLKYKAIPAAKFIKTAVGIGLMAKNVTSSLSKVKNK